MSIASPALMSSAESGSESRSHTSVLARSRRHAAVMFIDVVSFSRLMEADEDSALSRWLGARSTLIDPQLQTYRGRIVKSTGDGLLVEFESSLEAVRCALNVQRDMCAATLSNIDHGILELRIAVNFTEVMTDSDDIYGDGVNITARLQEFADPGGIVVTEPVRDEIARAGFLTQEIGLLSLKNINRKVAAFRVLDPSLAARVPQRVGGNTLQPSLVVMPGQYRHLDPSDEGFVESILDEISHTVAGASEVLVVARSTAMAFRDHAADPAVISRLLGVRYLVQVRASPSGDNILLNFELVDEKGQAVWSSRHMVPRVRPMTLPDELGRGIIAALIPNLNVAELRRIWTKKAENLDAYELVLKAAHLMHRLDDENLAVAKEELERAVALDPTYARSYSLLAEWHSLRIGQGLSEEPSHEYEQLSAVLRQALGRNPVDAQALSLYGHLKSWIGRDYDGALELLGAALKIAPNSVVAWTYSSPTFSYIGDADTAIAHAEFGLRLSPYDAHGYQMRAALALANYTKGAYDEAVRWGRRAVAVNPRYLAAHRFLCASLSANGQEQEAREAAQVLRTLAPNFSTDEFAARYAYADPEVNARFGRDLKAAGLPA